MQNKLGIGEIKSDQDYILLVEKKRDILRLILEVTHEQPEIYLADSEDIAQMLMDNIEARQVLIDMIGEIEEKLEAARRSGIDPKGAPDELEGECQLLLSDIMQSDKRNESLAVERIGFLKGELKKLNDKKMYSGAYDAPKTAFSQPVYFDKHN